MISAELPKPDTKQRILDAAEQLFARNGFAATSLRQITAAATVNLAAVNYHFQSKEALVQAVMLRTLTPVNRRRLELLDRLEAEHPAGALPLEGVLEAFFLPVLEAHGGHPAMREFPKLMGRMYVEPGGAFERLFEVAFSEIASRFQAAFERALPGAGRAAIAWGMHLGIGSMAHLIAGGRLLELISGGAAADEDAQPAHHPLLRFVAAGMRALSKPEVAST
jgi:AcrR family transcriptional regulator